MGGGRAGAPPFCSPGPRRLELAALQRVVLISAKPAKRLREALQPILAKHGLSAHQIELRRVSRGAGAGAGPGGGRRAAGPAGADLTPQPGEKQPLDLGQPVSSVAAQRLVLDTLPGRECGPQVWPPGV